MKAGGNTLNLADNNVIIYWITIKTTSAEFSIWFLSQDYLTKPVNTITVRQFLTLRMHFNSVYQNYILNMSQGFMDEPCTVRDNTSIPL